MFLRHANAGHHHRCPPRPPRDEHRRQRLRLLSALPMLERGERVTDIALACGYDSTSAFIAAFRTQIGMTPSQFASRQ